LRIHTRPDEATETIESLLPEALAQLEQSDDQRGLAKAHLAAYRVHWSAGRVAAARDAAGHAAEHARAAGDEGLRAHALGNYIGALQQGSWDPGEITPELDEIEREHQGPYLAASINRLRATLCCLEGRFDDARELVALAVADCEALGMGIRAAVFTDILVETELSAGDPVAALRALQRADEILVEQGERSNRSTVQAYLAAAYELVGDAAAASAAIATAEELSAPDDIVNFAITYAVRARLALSGGDDEAAERWARSAVEHAERTEFVWDRARARLTLAQVLSALERKEEAAAELRQAVELYERKGDRPRAEQARSLLAETAGPSG
jgi:tetratricopeptide (TPR) repeat protein